jgi:hypothetical protein
MGVKMDEIKPWIDVVRLHPDVEYGPFALSSYALDLGALVVGDPNIPKTYRDPYQFFKATYLTDSMWNLIKDVYDRLSGKDGNRVLQLRSPFGGGKSHTLATLYYAVKNRKEMELAIPEAKSLPELKDVRIAVFDGEKFDVVKGADINGLNIKTLWGFIAYQLGSYELVKEHDDKKIAPGGDIIKKILSDKPTLIILDEVSMYLERGMGEKVGETTLYGQTMGFLQTLTTEVAGSRFACLVYSLQASARELYGNVEVLETLDHLASRVDAKREPIQGDDIFFVIRKRLFAEPPDEEIANKVADLYIDILKKNIFAYVSSVEERMEIEEELTNYRRRFVNAYPFHPALIDLMRERWASIPNFQRTRGVLRFLAVVLRTLKNRGVSDYLISATDIPIDDLEVKNAFFTEVGQREPFQAVLEADLIGPNATVKKIDKELFKDKKEPAKKVAVAILMHSFGGLPNVEGEILPPGVGEGDLLKAVLSPVLDSTTCKAVLKELVAKCLYIHFDGMRYAFKTIPNVNKVLEDQVESIRDEDVESRIRDFLKSELAGKPAIIWPNQSRDIPDRERKFQIAFLPLDFAFKLDSEKEKIALEFMTQCGNTPRIYRNALALAVPDKTQVGPLKRAVKYLIAIERVKNKKRTLNLTDEHLEQLSEREKAEQTTKESALRNLYNSLWLLKMDNGTPTLEKIEIGGRPISTSNIFDRLMDFLMHSSPPKVFDRLTPRKFLELIKFDEVIELAHVVDLFFSSLEFPRIIDENVIKRVIQQCVREGLSGITSEDKVKKIKDKVLVNDQDVVIAKDIQEDEVDLHSGYLIKREVISSVTEPKISTFPSEKEKETAEQKESSPLNKINRVKYSLGGVTRKQLYKIFEAIGNLADKCGTISIIIDAQSVGGLDSTWLKNAVEEPIEEAGINLEKETD